MRTTEVTTVEELHEVWRLTHDEYVRMGYCDPQPNGILDHHHDIDLKPDGDLYPLTRVAIVRGKHGKLLGACSLTVDGSNGLHTDDTFWPQTEAVRDECRANNTILASSWRIIVSGSTKHRCLVASLIDQMFDWAADADVGVLLCTFNPKHAHFYRERLGMVELAKAEEEHGLVKAPSVLMRLDADRRCVWQQNREAFYCD